MNNNHTDDILLKQVDDLLGQGKTSDSTLMNDLVSMVPQAGMSFQQQLEERLVAQLQGKQPQKKKEPVPDRDVMMVAPTTRRPMPSFPVMRWVAVVMMVLAGGYLLAMYRQADPEMAIPLPIVPHSRTLVIATQNIRPGQTITGEMVGAITLSGEDFAELQNSQPNREFFSDPAQAIGRMPLVALKAFEPLEPRGLLSPEDTVLSSLIPPGRVAIVLPVADVPAGADQMDVIMSLPETNISMSDEDRAKIFDTEHFKIVNGVWEFRFTDLVILRVSEEQTIDPAVVDTMVTFHVTPEDAMAVQYLVEIGAEAQFASRVDETLSPPTFTPTPLELTPRADPEVCMELLPCRRNLYYYKIKLPLSRVSIPDALSAGDQVTLMQPSRSITIEDIVLVTVNDDTVTLAAPAWKYSLLLWLSQLDEPASYTLSLFDGVRETAVLEPMTPITMRLSTLDFVPEVFGLMVTIPEAQISQLSDLPYYGVRSSLQNGILTFSFPDIEMVSSDADASYIIRLTGGDAANLKYLLSLGAEFDVYMAGKYVPTPDANAFPTFTPSPASPLLESADEAVIRMPSIENKPCPAEASHCVTVPDHYSQIRLPLPTIPATGLWFDAGDRVELWLNPNDRDRVIVENVLFVGADRDTLIFAAPAWKYSVLSSFVETEWPIEYTLRPFDGTNFPTLAVSDVPTTYTLNSLAIPSEPFDLMVKVPSSRIEELAAVPHLISNVDSVLLEGAVYFYFPALEKPSTNSDSAYVVAVSSTEAAALDYLLSIGGEIHIATPSTDNGIPTPAATWTPTSIPMPTFTPESAPNDEVVIPQDRTVLSLPSKSPLPEVDQFDIIVSVAHDNTALMADISESLNRLPFQINITTWDLRFEDVELIDIYEPGSVDSANLDTIVRFHVKRVDASVLEYLVGKEAGVRFVAAGSVP